MTALKGFRDNCVPDDTHDFSQQLSFYQLLQNM